MLRVQMHAAMPSRPTSVIKKNVTFRMRRREDWELNVAPCTPQWGLRWVPHGCPTDLSRREADASND